MKNAKKKVLHTKQSNAEPQATENAVSVLNVAQGKEKVNGYMQNMRLPV